LRRGAHAINGKAAFGQAAYAAALPCCSLPCMNGQPSYHARSQLAPLVFVRARLLVVGASLHAGLGGIRLGRNLLIRQAVTGGGPLFASCPPWPFEAWGPVAPGEAVAGA